MSDRSFYFDPDAEGLEVFLGPTEALLMDLMWRLGGLTAKKALALIDSVPKPAHTTLITVLNRLVDKGLVRREKNGRSFVYHPLQTRETFLKERIERIRSSLRSNFPDCL